MESCFVTKRAGFLRVHYSISKYGMTLVPVLEVICGWGRRHLKRAACLR